MSAFGELDGEYVSPGQSDWTKKNQHIRWHDCKLYDTPGINGWGHGETRENLEATAREAVETADIVVLCFDSQNQQAMEFSKIASWIRDYGKPAVAVLNVRNLRWRHPAVVPAEQRGKLSDSVAQHADNIRTELTQIGLGDTPLVAVQSRRALFARAATPFKGPSTASFEHDRDAFGTDYLARWSNFHTLEDLLAAAINEGASDIRLSALREDVRKRCQLSATRLVGMSAEFLEAAEQAEDQIESLLAVIGYPTAEEQKQYLSGRDGDLLRSIEVARGTPFNSPLRGSLDRFVKHQAASHLASPRRRSEAQTKRTIEDVFANGTDMDESAFQAAVFDTDAIDKATNEVWRARSDFLARELKITTGRDADLEVDGLVKGASFTGLSGNNTAGDILRGAGIATGLAAVAVPFAVANIWNPAGWAVGLAVAGVGIAGQVQQFFGKRMREDAQKSRGEALAKATAEATEAVDATFDAYEDALRLASRSMSWSAIGPEVARAAQEVIDLRAASARSVRLAEVLNDSACSIRSSRTVGDVLARAQAALAESAVDVRQRLLGEDWIDGTNYPQSVEVDQTLHATYLIQANSSRVSLTESISSAFGASDSTAIRSWFAELDDLVFDDPDLLEPAKALRRASGTKPSFVVLGDYNSGKTSLIRRMLVEGGSTAGQDGLEILARPATATQMTYAFPRVDLIDTPGLQSGNNDHDAVAYQSETDASLVFVVVHVNLLIGNTSLLEEIASGSDAVASKAGRMVFVINRSDELGADPMIDPQSFVALQERKKDELVAALASKGIDVARGMIHCVAADPYGLVGNTPHAAVGDFDRHRLWDGAGALVGAVSDLENETLAAAAELAGFDSALTALKKYRQSLVAEASRSASEIAKRDSEIATLTAAESDANLLQRSIVESAERTVVAGVSIATETLHLAKVGDSAAVESAVSEWTGDPRFKQAVERFGTSAERDLLNWQEEHSSMLEREFRASSAREGEPIASDFTARSAIGAVDGAIGGAGAIADRAANLAQILGNRDAVYAIGKQFGHKFKPWGAVKGGARVAKVGAVLSVVAAAIDAKSMLDDGKKAQTHRQNIESAIADIEDQASQLVLQLTEGDASTGPVALIEKVRTELESLISEARHNRHELDALLDGTNTKIERTDRLLASGETVKNHSQEGNPQ